MAWVRLEKEKAEGKGIHADSGASSTGIENGEQVNRR